MPTSEGAWRRLHPIMFLFGIGDTIRRTIVPILVWGWISRNDASFAMTIIVIAMSFTLVFQVQRYFSFRYRYEDGQIVIHEGLFSRHIRVIPVWRIHNINTRQHLMARLFGVVRLDIETAGGGDAEASLAVISMREAAEIDAFVRAGKSQQVEAGPAHTDDALERLALSRILLAGATSNRVGVVAFGLLLLNQYFEFLGTDRWLSVMVGQAQQVAEQVSNVWWLAIGGLLVLLVGSWLFSVLTTLVRWYGFSLRRDGQDLKIRAGLFTLREYMVPLEKVQALRCRTSALRRPFGLFQLQVVSAGRVGLEEQSRVESDILTPIARREDIARFARYVLPRSAWSEVTWRGVDRYTRTLQFMYFVCLLAVLAWGVRLFGGAAWLALPLALPLALLAIAISFALAHANWRQTAYAVDREFIYLRTGLLGLHYWVIPIAKILNVAISESPGQRIRGLATVHLDLAGPSPVIEPDLPNIPLVQAWQLFERFVQPRTRQELASSRPVAETELNP